MKSKKNKDSLFTPKHRGGVIGGGGYNFQDAYIVSHLPGWMALPDFYSILKEGLEDVDVIFGESDNRKSWHYQLKDHRVVLREFKEVLQHFSEIADREDIQAERFILGCCGLAPNLESLWRKIIELRGLRKAHDDVTLESTKLDLLADINKLGVADYADFLLDTLEVDSDHSGLRDAEPTALLERFRGKFIKLPFYFQEAPEILDDIFTKLALLVNKSIRSGITREELQELIIAELAKAKRGPASVVYLHGWLKQEYDVPADFEVDWTKYFDHSTLRVPSPEAWHQELIPQLVELRQKFDQEGRKRTIWLRSRACLSAGLAFGQTFAEAAGYNIQVEQSSPAASEPLQYWQSDTVVEADMTLHIEEEAGIPDAQDVIVALGVTDDPRPKIQSYLEQVQLPVRASLYIAPNVGPSETSLNSQTVVAFARAAKSAIRSFCNTHQPRRIHLFYFGPLGLAVLLGQKLNGLADIQCYERNKTTGYTPSCLLPA